MSSKRQQRSRPLGAPVDTAKSALDQTGNVAGEVVDNVRDLTEPVRDIAASLVEMVSPTAARAIHPEGSRKRGSSQRSTPKRIKAASNRGAGKAAGRAGKAASRTVKAANRAVDRAQSAASGAVRGGGKKSGGAGSKGSKGSTGSRAGKASKGSKGGKKR